MIQDNFRFRFRIQNRICIVIEIGYNGHQLDGTDFGAEWAQNLLQSVNGIGVGIGLGKKATTL